MCDRQPKVSAVGAMDVPMVSLNDVGGYALIFDLFVIRIDVIEVYENDRYLFISINFVF